jgi:predicted AlkP superfamily phosphohydrolase/phosphomutase
VITGAKVLVLALDGVPHSFLQRAMAAGTLPNLTALAASGSFRPLLSVHPTVSSCAWASFMTGMGPAGHGLFGFVDRRPETWDLFIPTGRDVKAETLWEKLSRHGKRVVVLNVPGTYPPRDVNGVLVSGFLCTNLEKVSRDEKVVEQLRELDYRIDVDAWQARKEPAAVLEEVGLILDRRTQAALRFLEKGDWDFGMVHFMSVDRMQHFLWRQAEEGDEELHPRFMEMYARMDAHIGALLDAAGPDAEVFVLSDHGFCSIRKEVQLNRWLEEQGLLVYRDDFDPRRGLRNIDPARTRAYSLIPGRVFLNLQGREGDGIVKPGDEADALLTDIGERLLEWRDPDGGDAIVEAVLTGDALRDGPHGGGAPDLLVHAADGWDLKGRFGTPDVFESGPLSGMHTYGDAFLLRRNGPLPDDAGLSIIDVHRLVCDALGVDPTPVPRAA